MATTPMNARVAQRWDIARRLRAENGPDLYLPRGRCRVTAALPGLGEAAATVDADGDGDPIELQLVLAGG